jgi:hypothetical protein
VRSVGETLRTPIAIAVVTAFAFGGLVAALASSGRLMDLAGMTSSTPRPVWSEVPWPFPMDQWGKGKAFACTAADCGAEVKLYLRAKIGFCNCTTGVADDEELERLSDFDLMGKGTVTPLGNGRPITVAWMKGRSRSYAISSASALSVAFNDRCDAIVATVVQGRDRPDAIEPGVLEFLNGKTVLRWAEVTLGL